MTSWPSSWPRALTIEERARLAGATRARSLAERAKPTLLARARVRERLWRELPGFASNDIFERRLGLLGIQSRDHLLDLLAIDPADLAGTEAPQWVDAISAAYIDGPDPFAEERPKLLAKLAGNESNLWPEALNRLMEPLVARTLGEHAAGVRQEAAAAGALDDIELILGTRPIAAYRYLVGPFVLRMHIAERKAPRAGQFGDYIADILSGAGMQRLVAEYPVLGRVLAGIADLWARAETQLARRYLADRADIAAFLGIPADHLELSAVSPGLGDPHRGLQTVHALTTNNGIVVYKPTDCRIFEHVAALLHWLRGHDPGLGFKIPRALTRDGYGWVEYVHREECTTQAELAEFYTRIGSMVAIGWMLGSSDLHSENLIADRGMPVLVDLETIVGLRAGDTLRTQNWEALFGQMLQSSVLRTGLLPQRIPAADDASIDISALGVRPRQRVPLDAWRDVGKTQMRRERMDVEQLMADATPGLRGHGVANAADYIAEIDAGFGQACQLFLRHKDELASARSPLLGLCQARHRQLVRDTASYGRLAQQLNHPDLLADGADRDRHLDYLMCGAIGDPIMETVANEERRAVSRGDIPYFSVDGDSRDLLSDDLPVLHECFQTTPAEAVQERLHRLNDREIRRQRWYLTTSLTASRLYGTRREDIVPACCSDLADDEPSDTELQAAVERVAGELMTLRYDGGDDGMVWPTVRSFQGGDWQVVSAGNSLYGGTAGIALFLGLAGSVLGDQHMTSAARRSLEPVLREIQASRIRCVGAYEGAAGYLYVLTCLGGIWGTDYSELQHALLRTIRNSAADDSWLEVLSGVAGAGLVIANGGNRWGDENLVLEAAEACARRIEATRIEMPHEAAAWAAMQGEPPLTGFAHGAAGMSLACLRLGRLLGEPSLVSLSERARNFEMNHFLEHEGNWADLRRRANPFDAVPGSDPDPTPTIAAWCNGAVGIGMARCLAILDDPDSDRTEAVRDDVDIALGTARQRGCGVSHCFCHGDLGAMELHFAASRLPGYAAEARYARRIACMVARDVLARGPVCGVPSGMVVPGLMVGLAGIGFGLLRALRQDLPNVCSLEF